MTISCCRDRTLHRTHMAPARGGLTASAASAARVACALRALTRASVDAVSDAVRAGRLREHAAADTACSSRPRPSEAGRTRHGRHAAAAPWRRCDLRQRGERHTLSRRRFGREARAEYRHQKVKSSQVKSVRACTAAVRPLRAHLARVAVARGADADADAGGGGDAAGKAGRRVDVVGGALEHRNGT